MRTLLAATVAFAALASAALAKPAGPVGLTEAQMDRVTAGVRYYTPSFGGFQALGVPKVRPGRAPDVAGSSLARFRAHGGDLDNR